MNERSPRLSRIEQRERKALEADFLLQFKILGKELGWSFLKPTLFKRVGQWFVTVDPSIYRDERKAHISLKIKPFAIDDLLSRMTFGGGIGERPFSLRARGPLCLTSPCDERKLPPEGPVTDMLEVCRTFLAHAERVAENYNLEDFIAFVQEFNRRGAVNMNAVAAWVLQGNLARARELIDIGLAQGDEGNLGSMTPDGRFLGFFELADRWLIQNSKLGNPTA